MGAMNGKWPLISLVAPLRSKVNRKVMAEICRNEGGHPLRGGLRAALGTGRGCWPSFRLDDGGGGRGRGAAVFTLGEMWVFLAQTALQKRRAFPPAPPTPSHCPRAPPPVRVFLCTLPTAAMPTSPRSDPFMPFSAQGHLCEHPPAWAPFPRGPSLRVSHPELSKSRPGHAGSRPGPGAIGIGRDGRPGDGADTTDVKTDLVGAPRSFKRAAGLQFLGVFGCDCCEWRSVCWFLETSGLQAQMPLHLGLNVEVMSGPCERPEFAFTSCLLSPSLLHPSLLSSCFRFTC